MLRLAIERRQRDWSLRELARRTGIDHASLSRIERGLEPAYPGWRRRLAKILHVSGDELFRKVPGQRKNGRR